MRSRMLGLIFTAYYLMTLSRCSTEVDVGDNAKINKEKRDHAARVSKGKNGSTIAGDANGAEDSSVPGAKGQKGCLEAAEELPSDMQSFCTQLGDDTKKQFQNLLNPICEDYKFVNMLNSGCSWDGKDEQQEKFISVLDSTPANHDKKDDTYYNKVLYSLEVKNASQSYGDLIISEYSMPNVFKKSFQLTPNVQITPIDGVKEEANVKTIRYTYRLSALTRVIEFNSVMHVFSLSDKTTVILDTATDNLKGVKLRNHVSIVQNHGKSDQSVMVLEERKVDAVPSYSREWAKSMLFQADKYKMALIRNNMTK